MQDLEDSGIQTAQSFFNVMVEYKFKLNCCSVVSPLSTFIKVLIHLQKKNPQITLSLTSAFSLLPHAYLAVLRKQMIPAYIFKKIFPQLTLEGIGRCERGGRH